MPSSSTATVGGGVPRSRGGSLTVDKGLPAEGRPQPPSAAGDSAPAPVHVDLRRLPKEKRGFAADGPAFVQDNMSAELEACYQERQQKRARLRRNSTPSGSQTAGSQLKRGSLVGLRDKPLYGPFRGNELTTWQALPYRITRFRIRIFEGLMEGPWIRPARARALKQPWEGDLRSAFRPRLDWRPVRKGADKDWWETRATFRSGTKDQKATLNEEREVLSRVLSPTCKHLVVWGSDTALPKLDSRTSSIEYIINELIESPAYSEVYGKLDRAHCHASLPIDRREVPWPLKLIKSSKQQYSGGGGAVGSGGAVTPPLKFSANVCEFRSMFSSFLESYRSGERWNFSPSDDALRPPFENKQRVWTGVIEFDAHDSCANFFDATTYSNLDSNNLNALPDELGIKYWLHTILSTSIAATKLKPNRRVPEGPRQSWWDVSSKVWAPFLTAEDLVQAPWPAECGQVLPNKADGVEISSSCLRLCALSATKGDETVTVVVHNESKPLVQNYLNITGMLPSQTPLVRIPRYIIQQWTKSGPSPSVTIDETHKYAARVALLIFPIGRRLIISPCLLSSRAQFLAAEPPHVVDRGVSTLAAAPKTAAPSSAIPN